GAPLRFGNTVTVGIVSSIRRRGSRPKRPNWMKAYIQFDSAINPGSSGGALVNMEGQVIGVVTAMRKDAQGLGFAVPVNRLKRILPRLMGGHNITAATLGVEVQPMDEALARALGLKEPQGALLRDVGRGSPADAIGLVPGDVVLRYGGVTLRDHADLPWLVATSKVGESVELTILRDRQKVSLMAEPVAERRWKLSKAKRTGAEPNPPGGVGVTVASTEVARAIGFEGLSGVLVFQVDANTPAWRAGLRVGMWIAQVGDTPVPSPADFYQAVQDGLARDGAVRIRIYTQERQPQWMAWEAPPGD
ncbi:MAG: PDZ domain-containing protein, partial [Myxococcota bacterium]